jgi:hypothetical protein
MANSVGVLVEEIRGGVFFQEMRELASDIRALKEYVRHLDVKLDSLQEDIDELAKSLELRDKLREVERIVKNRNHRQQDQDASA